MGSGLTHHRYALGPRTALRLGPALIGVAITDIRAMVGIRFDMCVRNELSTGHILQGSRCALIKQIGRCALINQTCQRSLLLERSR